MSNLAFDTIGRVERPPAPIDTLPRTYYRSPLDRLLGRYTTEWNTPDGHFVIHSLSRIRDFEGHFPSALSIRKIPYVLRTARAVRRSPILADPVPFLVIDAIAHLDSVVKPEMRVLEIGGGNSTLWFLKRGAHVTTVEDSAVWSAHILAAVKKSFPIETQLRLRLVTAYGHSAYEFIAAEPDSTFDLVLIDSTNEKTRRNVCVKLSRSKVRSGGWLVLDNSDAPVNWEGVRLMSDLPRIRFTGYAPMALVVSQTSCWRVS